MYVYVYVYEYACVCVCLRARAFVRVCVCACRCKNDVMRDQRLIFQYHVCVVGGCGYVWGGGVGWVCSCIYAYIQTYMPVCTATYLADAIG